VVSAPRAPKAKVEPKAYTVNFKYSEKKGDGESVVVIARDYPHAVEEAIEEKVDPRHPVELEVIDPTIGQVLKVIGKGVKKATEVGAKYAFKGAKKAVKMAGSNAYIMFLIRQSYSRDVGMRTLARSKLRKNYPDVYNVMDWSRY
jgi:hypothetical protein